MPTRNNSPQQWMTVTDVAAQLGCTYRTVLQYIRGGDLEAVNLGGETNGKRYRVSQAAIDKFLKVKAVNAA